MFFPKSDLLMIIFSEKVIPSAELKCHVYVSHALASRVAV